MQWAGARHRFYASLFLVCASALIAAALWLSASTGASDAPEAAVAVERAWARPALEGGNGAVYLTIVNRGDTAVTLTGAAADIAHAVEIHETALVGAGAGAGDHGAAGHAATAHETGHGEAAHEHGGHAAGAHGDHSGSHGGHDSTGGQLSVNLGELPAAGTFAMHHIETLEIPGQSRVEFGPAGLHIMLINLKRTLAWGESFPITLHFSGAPSITVWVTVGDEPVNGH